MKKFMLVAVVAFWSSVFTIWITAALAPDAVAENPIAAERVISLEEVARHATPDDCWMAIDGKVYDFTGYLPSHPAAPDVMEEWCGREASEAYRTKGYGRAHSSRADAMMPEYLVGKLQGNQGP